MVRRSAAHLAREVSRLSTPLFFAARDTQYPSDFRARLRDDHVAFESGGSLQSTRRWWRDSGRRGPESSLYKVHDGRMASRDASRASRRIAFDGDDDVWDRRYRSSSRAPPAALA